MEAASALPVSAVAQLNGRAVKFPLTRRSDGRWQKVFKGKRYYFTGDPDEALAQWESLKSGLTQSEAATCLDSELCQTAEHLVSVDDIHPSPENIKLYGEIDTADPDYWKLCESVSLRGIIQALILTIDFFLVSGHRRLSAALRAGLKAVPCKVLNVRWSDLTVDERLQLLREHNRYRHKSVQQQIREEILDADPAEAAANLRRQRDRSIFQPERNGIEQLHIEGTKRRSEIGPQKAEHVAQIKRVVFEDRRQYWPLSVHGIHYPLLNQQFFRNSKQRIAYANDSASYKATSDLCTRLRLIGEIPWEAIDDGTRPLKEFRAFRDARAYVRQEMGQLFTGYWRDLLQSQPNHIEVLCEKNTIYHMVCKVTEKYQVPTSSARGFCSIDPWHDLCVRY